MDLQGFENQQFALFVSFAEIYNEFIYDLLVEAPAKGKHRPSLRIVQDRHQNYYIKGIISSEVSLYGVLNRDLRFVLVHGTYVHVLDRSSYA